ncbi:MAG: sodium:calcium antiporter [Muribaculaceae bacterium]|nr:sodium:calcium antiporter [Muribaculaceae bacterium]
MFHDILFLIIGLALVLGGANYLTDGATAIARKFKMSDLVIGMTVVAFGSSTPDLVVSLTSTLQDKGALAVANIVGANIFDILFVIGLCALVHPVVIGRATLQKVFPMVILSSVVMFLVACDVLVDGLPTNLIDRSDGLILLCFFVINCFVTYMVSKSPDTLATTAGNTEVSTKPLKMWLALVMVAGGLAGLVIGGNWFVSSASGIAEKAGMSQSLVGLTIVAIGSSLPDLSTSLIAAIKGHSGIAVGNIVGSCVLNVFFIIGLCATVKPLELGTVNAIDFGVLVVGSLLIWLFGWVWGRRTINRPEGAMLIICYIGYILYLILSNK